MFKIPIDGPSAATIRRIAEIIASEGGRAYLVGGWVRDRIIDPEQAPEDADIEVFGIAPEKLREVLTNNFKCNLYGKSFQVIGLSEHNIDVAIPRRELKTGSGHTDFDVQGDPDMSLAEAAARRDFTINSIYARIPDGLIEDPFDGMVDIKSKTLRHTTNRFTEDPLRVLRAMQFSARLGFRVHEDTVALSRTLTQENLSRERLFDEWKKLILKGNDFQLGLGFLKDCDWLRFYPELQALDNCEQDPKWHPEGNVWTHTLHCLNAFAKIRTGDEWEDLVIGFAVLCHDMGKPKTTIVENDRIRSPGHARQGVEIARAFLLSLTNHKHLIAEVLPLVKDHMTPFEFHQNKAGDSAIRRLAGRVKRIDRLVKVATADKGGRPPLPWKFPLPEGEWLLARAEELAVKDSIPKAILQGKHLLKIGHQPGPQLGQILKAAYEAQLDGKFKDVEGGLEWIRDRDS